MLFRSQISGAFTTFARTGNPNHKGLPQWKPYEATTRPTLIWNAEVRAVDDPYREERLARAAVRKG